jgi:predicted amidohydrolase
LKRVFWARREDGSSLYRRLFLLQACDAPSDRPARSTASPDIADPARPEGITMTSLRCASVQFRHRADDKAYNLSVIAEFAGQAADRGVRILAFPEMCITGYWHVRNLDRDKLVRLSEPAPEGESIRNVAALAEKYGMAIGAGFIERDRDGRLFNTYFVCQPNGAADWHRKLHAFENKHIDSGDRYTVFDTPWGVRVGILICWDNNIVENARATALLGADILLAPHQTGGCNSRSPHAMGLIDPGLWERRVQDRAAIEAEFRGPKGREWLLRWLPARAHDNGFFVLFSNGVGEDDGEVRTGNAMIIDPYGRILSETWKAEDQLVVADLDLDLLPMCTGRRWIRGRRPELYRLLTERLGHELDPREARFSDARVAPIDHSDRQGGSKG